MKENLKKVHSLPFR